MGVLSAFSSHSKVTSAGITVVSGSRLPRAISRSTVRSATVILPSPFISVLRSFSRLPRAISRSKVRSATVTLPSPFRSPL